MDDHIQADELYHGHITGLVYGGYYEEVCDELYTLISDISDYVPSDYALSTFRHVLTVAYKVHVQDQLLTVMVDLYNPSSVAGKAIYDTLQEVRLFFDDNSTLPSTDNNPFDFAKSVELFTTHMWC